MATWRNLLQNISVRKTKGKNMIKAKLNRDTLGKFLLNLGAVCSLTGFSMTDVLHLRSLSIFGSCCGIAYNFTRKPAQINACAWGGVFIAVNSVMIYKLVHDRSKEKLKFSENDMSLYQAHFEEHGVTTAQFFTVLTNPIPSDMIMAVCCM